MPDPKKDKTAKNLTPAPGTPAPQQAPGDDGPEILEPSPGGHAAAFDPEPDVPAASAAASAKQERGETGQQSTEKPKQFGGPGVEGRKTITGHDLLGLATPTRPNAKKSAEGITGHDLLKRK
ncbi:MAG: hypothetical protein HZA22_04660 [Nitrospirae bacterium]|nr:hypothetical protein [Nitrospirota bacterium]